MSYKKLQVYRGLKKDLPDPLDPGRVAHCYDTNELFVGSLEGNKRPNDLGIVNVKWFGAKGDGVTDDYQAIQNAIDSIRSDIPEGSGGIIFFPKGTYRVSKSIEVTGKNYVLQGDGQDNTIIDGQDLNSGEIILDFTGNIPPSGQFNFFSIKNMTVRDMSNPDDANKNKIGLSLNYCQKGYFENFRVSGMDVGIHVFGNSHINRFTSLDVLNNMTGVYLESVDGGANGNTFQDCNFRYNTTCPLDCSEVSYTRVIGGDFEPYNGTAKFGDFCYVDTLFERNNQGKWMVISGDNGEYRFHIASDGGKFPRPLIELTGDNNKIDVTGKGYDIIRDTSTGENNKIIIRNWETLLSHRIIRGFSSKNQISFPTDNVENLIPYSNSLGEWNITGDVSLNSSEINNENVVTIIKNDSNLIEITNQITGDFVKDDCIYISFDFKNLAGSGFGLKIDDDSFVSLSSTYNTDDKNKTIYCYKFSESKINPLLKIYNNSGGSGSACRLGNISVQETLSNYMNTMAEANVEYNYKSDVEPTSGTFFIGDTIKNTSPTELGTSPDKYIIDGWECVGFGTPGTFVERRIPTGN